MAYGARALQLGLRRCCVAAVTTATPAANTATTAAAAAMTRGMAQRAAAPATAAAQIRQFSGSAQRSAREDEGAVPTEGTTAEEAVAAEGAAAAAAAAAAETAASTAAAEESARPGRRPKLEWTAEDQKILDTIRSGKQKYVSLSAASAEKRKHYQHIMERLDAELEMRPPAPSRDALTEFWDSGAPDEDLNLNEKEDIYEENDMTSIAHAKLDDIRERRHYMRLIAWEMPLLAKLAKPFEPPTADMPLRFRYTSYMGEYHPAEKKVVVEFCPSDLGLTPVQEEKLKKLAGARYHPEKEIVRMACESFEHQAQNKRYLGDLVQKLISAAKDPTDTFADIPLDTRHYQAKPKPKFPKAWRMSEERKKELQAIRAASFQLDQKKAAEGKLVDGTQCIQRALAGPADGPGSDPVAELMRQVPSIGQTSLRR